MVGEVGLGGSCAVLCSDTDGFGSSSSLGGVMRGVLIVGRTLVLRRAFSVSDNGFTSKLSALRRVPRTGCDAPTVGWGECCCVTDGLGGSGF